MATHTTPVSRLPGTSNDRSANRSGKAKAQAGAKAPGGEATVHQFSARKYDHMTRMLEDALELAFADGVL